MMKNTNLVFLLFTLASIAICFTACDPNEEGHNDEVNYTATILSPSIEDKNVGDTIHIHTLFESEHEETIHHIKVRVYNKADNTEVYNKPEEAHIHETNGSFEYHDNCVLSVANGVTAHSDWIIEAKVWGHEAGSAETIETVEFHVHP